MNIKKLTLATTGLLLAGNVSAATFDFANIAQNNAPVADLVSFTGSAMGDFTGERGALEMNFTSGGIGLTASAGNDKAYLDSYSSGKPGGLGVCTTLNGSAQCDPSSDDNVTNGENLVLNFDQKVTITDTTFRNGGHGTAFLGTFDLSIDGASPVSYSLANLFDTPLTGTKFEFANNNGTTNTGNQYQFYIETLEVTAVPVPAAAWLFGSGLLGLVGIARRKS